MTARTSQKLADALRSAGFEALALRAEADEFHDFLSPHALPETLLDQELVTLVNDTSLDASSRIAARDIRQRHHEGAFDADLKESDDWAASADGRAAFDALASGLKGG